MPALEPAPWRPRRVSVVVACRNEAATLPACLDALRAQVVPDLEIIVVDGHSTDGSAEIARSAGLRIHEDPGRGPAAARNVGIAASRGDVVAFTDADCLPRPDWLSHLVVPFGDRSVAGVAGAMRMPRATLLGRLEDNDALAFYRGFITANVAYRRDALLEVGGFDEDLLCAEDYDLAWRVLEAGHRIEHARDAIVLHAPPELGSWGAYLAKQFWYAREDVPANVRALRRGWRARAPLLGARQAARGLASALGTSAWVAAAAGGALAGQTPLLGLSLGTLAGAASWSVARGVRVVGEGAWEAPAMAAAATAKSFARGAGTLVGVAAAAKREACDAFTSRRAARAARGAPGAPRRAAG